MIALEHASRWYGQVIGLNDVSCKVSPGLTALLGPNGAGKSTMLKLITGQIRPTTGKVEVFGQKPFANAGVFRKLGYCPEIDSFYDDMTGREFVTLLAAMSGFSGAELRRRVADSIERVGMTARCDSKIAGYSKGMRQRVKFAQGIVHDPDVLILDEPLNGLDPVARRDVSALLAELAKEGKCVLISSHILHEVEQLTRNILMIHRGRLVAQGDLFQIRSLIDKHPHRIAIVAANPRAVAAELLKLPSVLSVRFSAKSDRELEIETSQPDQFYSAFPELALANGFDVESFQSPDNNLEAVFKYLVQA
jgi:ABC-2 type transport system ATP-binding protein